MALSALMFEAGSEAGSEEGWGIWGGREAGVGHHASCIVEEGRDDGPGSGPGRASE